MKIKQTRIVLFILLSINLLFINEIKSQYSIAGTPGTIYVDIIPDTLLNPPPQYNSEQYYIDINQDAINDIEITATFYQSPGATRLDIIISSLNSFTSFSLGNIDSVMNGSSVCWYFSMLKVYNNGDTIENANYITQGYLGYWTVQSGGCSGAGNEWINQGDKFFGVKYQTASDTSYGWVKVNVTGSQTVLIKEFSLGSPTSCINSFDINNFITVYPNPATDKMYLLQYLNGEMEISLFDVYGKQVSETIKNRNQKTEMDVSNLSEGIYFMQVNSNEGIVTKKVIVQH